jgi:hypothetical protein
MNSPKRSKASGISKRYIQVTVEGDLLISNCDSTLRSLVGGGFAYRSVQRPINAYGTIHVRDTLRALV